MDAYCSSVLYLCCLQLDPSRTSLCRMSTTSAKENSRTFLSFDLWKGSISLFVFFTKKTTTYFSTFCFWISFHSISIHSHSDQHWRTCFQLGTCNMSPFAVDRKTYTRFVVVFFQSFSRSFYSSLILLSLLTFFITHCISCVGGSLIFHGMETSSPERQRSSPIDKCQDSLHSFTLPVQTFTARIRLATSTESNHSHSIHVKHERFTQTTFFQQLPLCETDSRSSWANCCLSFVSLYSYSLLFYYSQASYSSLPFWLLSLPWATLVCCIGSHLVKKIYVTLLHRRSEIEVVICINSSVKL